MTPTLLKAYEKNINIAESLRAMKTVRQVGIVVLLVLVSLMVLSGCKPVNKEITDPLETANDITDFQELIRRASKIETYRYELQDSAFPEGYTYLFKGRLIKVELPDERTADDGDIYDEVFLDRVTKNALAHCNYETCEPLDRKLEYVDYDDFYHLDPLEEMYQINKAEFVKNEMLGQNIVKVFDIEYKGNPGRIWVQEYYGFPISIKYEEVDGSIRTIFFKDMVIDNVRMIEVFPPFNFTVEGVSYPTLYHYYGIYPYNQWDPNTWPGQDIEAVEALDIEEFTDVTDQILS